MEIKTKIRNDILIIDVRKKIESNEICEGFEGSTPSEIFKEIIEDANEKHSIVHVIINLKETTYIDSVVIGTFVGIHKKVHDRGGALILCGLSPELEALFAGLGLDKILKMIPDESAAISRIKVMKA